MHPDPAAIIAGRNVLQVRNVPFRLVSSSRSQSLDRKLGDAVLEEGAGHVHEQPGRAVPALDLAAQAQHLLLGADVAAVVGADGHVDAGGREAVVGQPADDRPADRARRARDERDAGIAHSPRPRVSATMRRRTCGRPGAGRRPVNGIVRVAVRSTPRSAVAASAMSAVRNVTSSVAGSSIAGGSSSPSRSTAARAPARISSQAFAGVQALGGEARDRPLHRRRPRSRAERLGLVGRRLVAGDQRDRDAVVQRDQRVHPGLAGDDPVEA